MANRSTDYKHLHSYATNLRRKGFSYSEIQKSIPVSKSTLSLWLRDIKLNGNAKTRLKKRMLSGQPYGARAQKRLRLQKTKILFDNALQDIGVIDKKQLMLIGTALYWAEGTKQKENNPSQLVSFNNSDPKMINVFLKWLSVCLNIPDQRIKFEIYSHESIRQREQEIIKYWSNATGFSTVNFRKIRYKSDISGNTRKSKDKMYYGLLRVTISRSTDLNRKIPGWVEGIYRKCDRL